MNGSLALYLHIPFCLARCAYCDFNTFAGLEALHRPFADALATEIRRAGEARGRPRVHTIFIGGGTPTVLPPELLAGLLDACREAFDVAPIAEITSEANPGSLTALKTNGHVAPVATLDISRVRGSADERGEEKPSALVHTRPRPLLQAHTVDRAHFAALRELGVNRLSLGVQSFDDAELRWLERIHTAAEAETAFQAARAAGFDNINLDFIFGLPGQAAATWARTLDRAIRLAPEHLSLYSLTVEHGTPLFDRVRRGLASAPDDDLAAALYEQACERLASAGYEQYEISNWARKDEGRTTNDERTPLVFRPSSFVCRHNLVYWHHEPYLGFGPGAHSFDSARRWWNVKPVPEYIRRVEAGRPAERDGEAIDRRTALGEFMLLGLRLVAEGVTDARFRARFGVGLEDAFGAEIAGLIGRGLLERLPDRVRLTQAGRLLGNQVFAEFL